jgi:putative DNA primase/helicase
MIGVPLINGGIVELVTPDHVRSYFASLSQDVIGVSDPAFEFEKQLPRVVEVARRACLGKADVADRLWRIAEAAGLLINHDADWLQERLATAFSYEAPTTVKGHADLPKHDGIDKLVIKRASEITPQPVMWLWPGRIAIGKQTLIAGEPGLGKSQIATALVAAVTTGGQWPHQEGCAPSGNAIILSAEDGVADKIVPRLHAAQANCERAYIISAVRNHERLRTFNLQADLALLEQTIDQIGDVRLVVIDPISSYMGAIDSHKNTDVRSVLEAVGEMAERRHIAIVGATHFSKGAGQRAVNSFIGSVAFIAAARAAFAVMKDSDDETRCLCQ